MKSQVEFIAKEKVKVIQDYIEKDPELLEFMLIHCSPNTRKTFFPEKKIVFNRTKIPNDPGLLSIIKEFEGRFFKERYSILITYDENVFQVKDLAFEYYDEDAYSFLQQWKNAPVLVL